jgi:hypothetical protein
MNIIQYLKELGVPTMCNGKVSMSEGGYPYLHFGDDYKDGTGVNLWLAATMVERNGIQANHVFPLTEVVKMIVVETTNAQGEIRYKLTDTPPQMNLMDFLSEEDQALFAELEASSATVI